MKAKWLFILWAITLALVFLCLRFGLNDWMHPREVSYMETNPFRPIFRLAFATVMTLLLFVSAGLITRKALQD